MFYLKSVINRDTKLTENLVLTEG